MKIVEHGEERLLAVCGRADPPVCFKPFHLLPANEDEMAFFNELLKNRYSRGPARLFLVCPHCDFRFQILASILKVCNCRQEPHNADHKKSEPLPDSYE
jgi:hypothetical protein